MGVQLLLKAAVPLAGILATAWDRCRKTGPLQTPASPGAVLQRARRMYIHVWMEPSATNGQSRQQMWRHNRKRYDVTIKKGSSTVRVIPLKIHSVVTKNRYHKSLDVVTCYIIHGHCMSPPTRVFTSMCMWFISLEMEELNVRIFVP